MSSDQNTWTMRGAIRFLGKFVEPEYIPKAIGELEMIQLEQLPTLKQRTDILKKSCSLTSEELSLPTCVDQVISGQRKTLPGWGTMQICGAEEFPIITKAAVSAPHSAGVERACCAHNLTLKDA